MTRQRNILLTPDFSRVITTARAAKPFQRFLVTPLKAVKTALLRLDALHTWLKPGVNKSGGRAATLFL
jgi:hypothetical protein